MPDQHPDFPPPPPPAVTPRSTDDASQGDAAGRRRSREQGEDRRGRLGWYGPSALLLLVGLVAMLLGPWLGQRIEYAATAARIEHIRHELQDNQTLRELSTSFRKVSHVIQPSVVHVKVYRREPAGRNPFSTQQQPPQNDDTYDVPQQHGTGSGWAYAHQQPDGQTRTYIITCHHVVEDADRIVVRFQDKTEKVARVVGQDPKTDVAVLMVKADLHPAQLGTDPEQGDIVFAFGSPFGNEFSMSQGIVSGKGRRTGIFRMRQGYEDFLQTDAAINPGNSGGPLTNIYGQVVGMNTAIATKTGWYNGVGYAIPIDMVKQIADQLIEQGKVSRGFLGVHIRTLDAKDAESFGFDGPAVLIANAIEGGPAKAAGLARGDLITHINGQRISDTDDLRALVADMAPGTKVTLRIWRGKASKDVDITLAEMPTDPAQIAKAPGDEGPGEGLSGKDLLRFFGIEGYVDVTQEMAQKYGGRIKQGVMVQRVRTGSIAEQAGLARGEIITHVMGTRVNNISDLITALDNQEPGRSIRITIWRAGQEAYRFLQWPAE